MRTIVKSAVAAFFCLTSPLFAGAITQVELEPISHADASLVVAAVDGTEVVYTPAQLETFPTYGLTTKTPWRDEPAYFEGVLLSDILAASGLERASGIVVTAENDYSTVISRDVMSAVQILVATRVNGQAHSRRSRGPIQFVIDMDTFTASDLTSSSNLVWMAARIEAQN